MSATGRPVITVNNGKIRGFKQTSAFSGHHYYSFLGIPYAEPPIKANSFKPPRTKKNWPGVLDCTREKSKCIQYSLATHKIEGSEDCLYLNVHIPELPSPNSPPKPVMVLIHPGGHLCGSAHMNEFGSPNFLIHRDIIYVTFHYRLDIYGFLNLNIRDCSGNMGLKDVVMALQWVKDNIQHFNGDPDNITALGPSSGASIYQLLLCIPSTEGLFHKAVLMGDVIFNTFVEYRDDNIEPAIEFARVLNFHNTEPAHLLEFFKSQDPMVIMDAMRTMQICFRLSNAKIFPAGVFMPSVEKVGKNPLLTVSPSKLLTSMRTVPTIMGFCEREAIFGFVESRRLATLMAFKDTAFFQNRWGWMRQVNKNRNKMVDKILRFYLNDKQLHEDIAILSEMCTDQLVFDSYQTAIDIMAKKFPRSTYVYRFEHVGALGEQKKKVSPLLIQPLNGTLHLDDFYNLSNTTVPDINSTDYKVVDMLTKWFTNFAKTGNPNQSNDEPVYWEPSSPNQPCYLRIKETPQLCQGTLLSEEKMEFWKRLKAEFHSENE